MEYLKDKQYYIDRYDLFTIKECLEMVDVCRTSYAESVKIQEGKKVPKGEIAKAANWFTSQLLFQVKGRRYSQKEETIQKWVDKDTIEQNKFDTTPEPQRIFCPDCKKLMHVRLKHLDYIDDPLRMMFLFECASCKKKRWIYEDGTELESKPDLCPKCKKEAEISAIKQEKDKVTWKTTCSSCGFIETKVEDFTKGRAERKKREEEDAALLKNYRVNYCSEEKGKEAFEYIEASKVAKVIYEEEINKYDSISYQKASLLKKLNIGELEKLLREALEKEHFVKLTFDNPQMGQHVIVGFTLQDEEATRRIEAGMSQLQKLIKTILEGTNWRLMAEGVSYRLGYISGRLKGYEREEELIELSGEKKEERKSKIDHETMMKYAGHSVVQLARVTAEVQGEENARKRRLEKEPEGFIMGTKEEITDCIICGENRPGNEIWYTSNGRHCLDCYRNIQEGVIPPLGHMYMSENIYFKKWELSSDSGFGIHGSTARKLIRQGLLHSRDLKRKDGTVYETIYLVEENKEFLTKYPRKPRQKYTVTDLFGEKLEL